MNHIQAPAARVDANWLAGIVHNPHNAEQCVLAGHSFVQKGWWSEAEACYRQALDLVPESPLAYNGIGFILQARGDREGAIASYRKALQINPNFSAARRNLARLLIGIGQRKESARLFYEEMLAGVEGANWMTGLTTEAMQNRDLTLAGEAASLLAELRWGSTIYPPRLDGSLPPAPVQSPEVFLTIPKLQHDIEQFRYLQDRGVLGGEYTAIIQEYQRVIDRLTERGIKERVPLDDEAQQAIGHVYNRIVHVRDTPRLKHALSDKWDGAAVEKQYLSQPPGVVVVDDFLSPEALESLSAFCLESTVWTGNRYAHGRLGAFFHDGFTCPLLLQIAEELRNTLPNMIGDRHPLRQLWGFKNNYHLPGESSTHADFAAVNVNFWITPDEANLDDTSGGLVVYGVDAPLNWDFYTYNGRLDVIKSFLQEQQASSITIPYRQNRAIIFNSDLFHETAEVNFRKGYENRRINITMLYGDREDDTNHQPIAHRAIADDQNTSAWRSAAFARFRKGRG